LRRLFSAVNDKSDRAKGEKIDDFEFLKFENDVKLMTNIQRIKDLEGELEGFIFILRSLMLRLSDDDTNRCRFQRKQPT
jgi:CRISPR/Cas system CSM-associated protein Csm2 small subunit